jgi:membrane fusion protein, multidrug efflux system
MKVGPITDSSLGQLRQGWPRTCCEHQCDFNSPNSMLTPRIFPVLLAIVSALLVSNCRPSAGGPPPSPPPPQVSVVAAAEKEVVEWDEYTGRLDAKESVEVRARVSGYLDQVNFQEGKLVKAGDLLFTIDKRPYAAEHAASLAERDQAQSRADLALSDAERAKKLIDTRAISQEDFETKIKAAAEARSVVKAAEARLAIAQLNLDFCEVRSPIAGRVSRALVTQGNLIIGGTVGTTLLTTIVSVDPVYAFVDVDERASLKYRRLASSGKRASAMEVKIPCEMALSDEQGFPHSGEVDFVDNRINASTGTVTARAVFANDKNLLSPGMFVRLRVPGSGKYKAVLIPDRALANDQAQRFVYVVAPDSKAQFRPVKLGPIIDGLRVVTEGLQTGDKVIVDGIINVRPGSPVTVVTPETPAPKAAP